MQEGIVEEINLKRGMFIVSYRRGYAVFELLDVIQIEAGARIRGRLDVLGSGTLVHLAQRCEFKVYGQSGPSSLNVCRRMLVN